VKLSDGEKLIILMLADMYKAMKIMRAGLHSRSLNVDEMIEILNAAIHPSHRQGTSL
jgi:plasmid stability protein